MLENIKRRINRKPTGCKNHYWSRKNNCVGRVQDLLNNAAKELETQIPHLSNKQTGKLTFESKKSKPQMTNDQNSKPPKIAGGKNIPSARNPVKTETIEPEKTILKEKGRNR